MAVEDVAEDYLMELINRSLIQITKVREDGIPVTCRIHDLLREILLSKSRELNIMTVATGQQHERRPGKVRRLAIHSWHDNTPDFNSCKHLRSLITFGYMGSMSKSFISDILSGGSGLLRTLDLESAKLKKIPVEVFNLFNLRRLCLENTRVEIVPKYIGKLVNLEYLDLTGTGVKELPEEILKLRRLREISLYSWQEDWPFGTYICGFQAPYKIGALLSLQDLYMIDADTDKIIVTEIGKLTQLRRLGIGKLRREDGNELCSSLEKLKNLVDLLVSSENCERIDLESRCLSSSLQFLTFLSLNCRLEKLPQWIPSLQGLTRLELISSYLRDGQLESLQHLPNLLHLSLDFAFECEGLCFKAGGFLKLEILSIKMQFSLRWMKVEEGSMPHLKEIYLSGLYELPRGIQHLNELKCVRLEAMSDNLKAKLWNRDEGSEEYREIAHVPEIIIAGMGRNGWEKRYL